MAGIIEVREGVLWSMAGWVFRGVLEPVAEDLRAQDPALAAEITECVEENLGYFVLSTLDAARFARVWRCVQAEHARASAAAAESPAQEAAYHGYLCALDELLLLLAEDPRAHVS